jgi:hypothetical protein
MFAAALSGALAAQRAPPNVTVLVSVCEEVADEALRCVQKRR